uniref:Uncharacterized protein n=1 Tax=Oryzias latipes TaxID=8090 RepID=A0A3B3H2F3_ORYLA
CKTSIMLINILLGSYTLIKPINLGPKAPEEYLFVTLEWEKFNSRVPKDAVRIREGDEMYVCRNMEKKCMVGILKGSKCEYEEGGNLKNPDSFEVLINKDDFEDPKWKPVKCTREVEEVRENAVKICEDQNLFVGTKGEEAKSLPAVKSASEQKFAHSSVGKWLNSLRPVKYLEKKTGSCQVLIVSYENVMEQEILDFKKMGGNEGEKTTDLGIDDRFMVEVLNSGKKEVTETVQSKTTTKQERRWDFTYTITAGGKLTVGVDPSGLKEAGSKFTTGFKAALELNLQYTTTTHNGLSVVKENEHMTSTLVPVPANSKCTVNLVIRKIREETPFTANIYRKFKRGEPKIKPISGTYFFTFRKAEASIVQCESLDGNRAESKGNIIILIRFC